MRRKITPYCSCHHSIDRHVLYEDVGPDGEADAKCKRCDCTAFCYDHEYSVDTDDEAYEQAMRWRLNR